MKKTVVGVLETVVISGRKFKARIDTGARMCSIDKRLAKKLSLGPIVRTTKIRSTHGESKRPVVRFPIKIGGRNIKASFNLADRSKMRYRILIGRNLLRNNFLIDISK
ncbi:MAG: ATP-dependent zinc protease [Nanoarchaeota archaeon]|nr:ATP-dependent zinc protease [Nanoarchaeota archaeon]